MTAPDIDLDALEAAALAATGRGSRTEFLLSTNSDVDDWMQSFYTKGDDTDFRLHCLWAWQEQERRKSAIILNLIRRLRAAEGATK